MNKNVKNLKKTPFSFFTNLDLPIKVRASEFRILCLVFRFCMIFCPVFRFLTGPNAPPQTIISFAIIIIKVLKHGTFKTPCFITEGCNTYMYRGLPPTPYKKNNHRKMMSPYNVITSKNMPLYITS